MMGKESVTSSPPLQYLKNTCLYKAPMLMANEGVNSSAEAAKGQRLSPRHSSGTSLKIRCSIPNPVAR
jgi:hypothetical protein